MISNQHASVLGDLSAEVPGAELNERRSSLDILFKCRRVGRSCNETEECCNFQYGVLCLYDIENVSKGRTCTLF